jgi:hypothetical protein
MRDVFERWRNKGGNGHDSAPALAIPKRADIADLIPYLAQKRPSAQPQPAEVSGHI